jgi:hypothetical protein
LFCHRNEIFKPVHKYFRNDPTRWLALEYCVWGVLLVRCLKFVLGKIIIVGIKIPVALIHKTTVIKKLPSAAVKVPT